MLVIFALENCLIAFVTPFSQLEALDFMHSKLATNNRFVAIFADCYLFCWFHHSKLILLKRETHNSNQLNRDHRLVLQIYITMRVLNSLCSILLLTRFNVPVRAMIVVFYWSAFYSLQVGVWYFDCEKLAILSSVLHLENPSQDGVFFLLSANPYVVFYLNKNKLRKVSLPILNHLLYFVPLHHFLNFKSN